MLHFLLATEKLVIKFAVNKISDTRFSNLYHEKFGYFEFPDGTTVAHSGSFNETVSGQQFNNESVRFFLLWIKTLTSGERKLLKIQITIGKNDSVEVHPLNEKTLKLIKESAPKNRPKYKKPEEETEETEETDENNEKSDDLREYQKNAIEKWERKGCKGILEHATGSGKTFTALNAIKNAFEKNNPFVVIGVPYRLLAWQWSEECENFFNKLDLDYRIVNCWSDNNSWERGTTGIFRQKN